MEFKTCLASRRSVRKYRSETVPRELLEKLLEAGSLAPSGKNGQPWRFYVIQRDRALLGRVAALTAYRAFVREADCLVCVFLDKCASYHYVKDVQAAGACIQNMLLAAADAGLGACWIGEILNRDLFVKRALGLGHGLDLMAVIAIGWPAESPKGPEKRSWRQNLLEWR